MSTPSDALESKTMKRMLIVDDEPGVLAALKRTLHHHFAQTLLVETCPDPMQALERVREEHYDVVLSDLRMPGLDGLSFLTLVSALSPHSLRLMLTATADFDSAQRAVNESGVFRYLTKPWNNDMLRSHVAAALQAVDEAALAK